MKRKLIIFGVIGLAAVLGGSVLAYESYYTPQGIACPNIFATVSFIGAKGFVTSVHPTPQTTEFVLLPSSMGEIETSYSSQSDDLVTSSFMDQVPVWKVNLTTGSLDNSYGLNVTRTSLVLENSHTVMANYTIVAGPSEGLFVLGFPSTCLSTIVEIGSQPYTGPLSWLKGTRA